MSIVIVKILEKIINRISGFQGKFNKSKVLRIKKNIWKMLLVVTETCAYFD